MTSRKWASKFSDYLDFKQQVGSGACSTGEPLDALRPPIPGENLSELPDVSVVLAGGSEVKMKYGKGGSIVGCEGTEPIVPMGQVTSLLQCRLVWNQDGVRLMHPDRGSITVKIVDGCPMVDHDTALALSLIKALEEKQWGKAKIAQLRAEDLSWKKEWIARIAEEHPAFRGLPQKIRDALKEEPCGFLKPFANRRRRKLWKREGVVLHLYAGENEGYTLARALKEVGADHRRLHEVDILRTGEHQDMGTGGSAYGKRLHLAMEGQVKGVLAGPPCRTRSVLRHMEVDGVDGLPRPVRSWNQEEFGMGRNTPKEQEQVEEDDILMFRAWMIWIVAEEMRKLNGVEESTAFGLKQPAIPHNEEVVTIWKTEQWKGFAEAYGFVRQSFNQGDYGGRAKKPTSWGGNLPLILPKSRGGGVARDVRGKTKEEILEESRKLSRWAPGMMRAVAIQVQSRVFGKKVIFKKLSWEEHLNGNHHPFRKDCRVCQEACARDFQHRRTKLPARAGVLSVDMAGPFRPAPDLVRGNTAKYFLAATFTWPDPCQDGEEEAEHLEDLGCPEDAPCIEAEEEAPIDLSKKKRGRPTKAEVEAQRQAKEKEEIERLEAEVQVEKDGGEDDLQALEDELHAMGKEKTREERNEEDEEGEEKEEVLKFTQRPVPDVEYEPSVLEEGQEGQEVRKDPKIKFFRFITPLKSRDKGEVLKAIVDLYLRLRSAGMFVQQIHSDNAGEFRSAPLNQWCTQRGILQTYTAGDQPQSNGRAEQTVAELKSRIRRTLLAAMWT